MSKVRFPHDSLVTKENNGTVYYEIEVDTQGRIVDFQVIISVNAVLDNEVRTKLQLTDGMWKPMFIDGRASNYKIRDKVYFEMR